MRVPSSNPSSGSAQERQLKQGVMQELLTGRKRLPGQGSGGERLGELAEIVMGQSPRSAHYNKKEMAALIQGMPISPSQDH